MVSTRRAAAETSPAVARTTSLTRFAETAEAVAATSSKLSKVKLLGDYLRELHGDGLALATRYFAARVFPVGDARTVGVGGSALSQVFLEMGGTDDAELSRLWRRYADAGDCAYHVVSNTSPSPKASSSPLDLLEVEAAFDALARAEGSRARTLALAELLARCTALEAKYIVKLITGDMRIGLREGLVEEAVGKAFGRDPAAVSRAAMILGDLGEVARLALDDALASVAPRLFMPLRFMLASPVADAEEAVRRLGEDVWVEDKYDGIRCQLHRSKDRVALFSRDLRDVTGQFPEVAQAAALLPALLILDGELLAPSVSRGHESLQSLQGVDILRSLVMAPAHNSGKAQRITRAVSG